MKRKPDQPQPVIGYCRVSTEEQSAEGFSLEGQERKIRAYAEYSGAPECRMHSDAGISGKKMHNRPGLLAALDEACACKGVFVVYSLSRMSRNKLDIFAIAERLQKAGADLVSLSEKIDTTTAAGRMFFGFMAVISQFEREQLGERVSMGMQQKKQSGETYALAPYGWIDEGGKLSPSEGEQAVLSTIRNLRTSGLGARKIAHYLNEQGISPKRGRTWYPSSVASILKTSATMPQPEQPCAATM